MALVHIIQVGQVHVNQVVELPFGADVDDSGPAVFQMMYRGLTRGLAEVFVNERKAADLRPYSFASEGDWFQTTFITPERVVGRRNVIRFSPSSVDPGVDPTGYWISNLVCFARQGA